MKVHMERTKHNKKSVKKGSKEKSSSNQIDNKVTNLLTDFDEAEMLCLPNSNRNFFTETSKRNTSSKYPESYNAQKYMKLDTAEERRKYRNSKDQRNNVQNKAVELVPGICLRQVRGEKCLDMMCAYGHELRLPKKLRLCKYWKNGFCHNGHFCFYLHSEFPCRYHYLGLNSHRHDPKTCIFYHGGPLSQKYEEMFLESVDPNKFPKAREMYNKQVLKLQGCNSINSQLREDTFSSKTNEEQKTQSSCDMVAKNENKQVPVPVTTVKSGSSVHENGWKSSDENELQIVEDGLQTDEKSLHIDDTRLQNNQNGLQIDSSFKIDKIRLQIDSKEASVTAVKSESGVCKEDGELSDETKLQIDEVCLQIDDAALQIDETALQIDENTLQIDESTLKIDDTVQKIGEPSDQRD